MIIEVETKVKEEPAIKKMARLITQGNAREFVNLFPTVRLKRVASSMFIHVTKSGVVKENIPQIMFHDEEYLVVASHMGFLPDKNPLAAVWLKSYLRNHFSPRRDSMNPKHVIFLTQYPGMAEINLPRPCYTGFCSRKGRRK